MFDPSQSDSIASVIYVNSNNSETDSTTGLVYTFNANDSNNNNLTNHVSSSQQLKLDAFYR